MVVMSVEVFGLEAEPFGPALNGPLDRHWPGETGKDPEEGSVYAMRHMDAKRPA